VDTEGLALKAKVHRAKVPDRDGIKLLLNGVRDHLPRLSHLWVDAGYQGRGKEWAEQELGLSIDVVKEGWEIDWQILLSRRGFEVLPRRFMWWSEPSLLALSEQADELRDYERLCSTAEAFVYVAMARLMVRRLARA
jgi:putative transposase